MSGFIVSIDSESYSVSDTVPREKAVIILRNDRAHDIRVNLWMDPKVLSEKSELASTLKVVHTHVGSRVAIRNVYVTEFKTSKGVKIYEGNVNEVSKFAMEPLSSTNQRPSFIFETKVVTASPMDLPLNDVRSAIMQFTKVRVTNIWPIVLCTCVIVFVWSCACRPLLVWST